jgi:3-hydroxyacyl-CoA dehydrogenase
MPDGEGLIQPTPIRRVAIVGTGVIGASWASNFLAQGLDVSAFDPAPGWAERLRATVAAQWPVLASMGLAAGADPGRLRVAETLEAAIEGAEFVQENGPERLEAKRALFGAMDAVCPAEVVIASSSSTLKVSDVQGGLRYPERIVLGHPFNPPHLIPLVEVVGGAATNEASIETAMGFYRQVGKRPIRLQAALWQEAFNLLIEGVADAADIDTAIAHGPGLRWALLGPFLNLHLSGGPGGIEHMLAHLGPPTAAMWRDLGRVELTPEVAALVGRSVMERIGALDLPAVVAERDATLVGLLKAKAATGLP